MACPEGAVFPAAVSRFRASDAVEDNRGVAREADTIAGTLALFGTLRAGSETGGDSGRLDNAPKGGGDATRRRASFTGGAEVTAPSGAVTRRVASGGAALIAGLVAVAGETRRTAGERVKLTSLFAGELATTGLGFTGGGTTAAAGFGATTGFTGLGVGVTFAGPAIGFSGLDSGVPSGLTGLGLAVGVPRAGDDGSDANAGVFTGVKFLPAGLLGPAAPAPPFAKMAATDATRPPRPPRADRTSSL